MAFGHDDILYLENMTMQMIIEKEIPAIVGRFVDFFFRTRCTGCYQDMIMEYQVCLDKHIPDTYKVLVCNEIKQVVADLDLATRISVSTLWRLRYTAEECKVHVTKTVVHNIMEAGRGQEVLCRIYDMCLAAKVIQAWWRWVIADPGRTACLRRLQREANEICPN